MIDRDNVYQKPHQIIDIADWEIHQDYEVFPIGARDKSLHVCPTPAPFSFCLPDHRYLFKEAIRSASKTPISLATRTSTGPRSSLFASVG